MVITSQPDTLHDPPLPVDDNYVARLQLAKRLHGVGPDFAGATVPPDDHGA
jgi:hypothetical protein